MSNLNIYVGSKDERDTVNGVLSQVTALLDLETYKGATSSSLIRWLGKQDPIALAEVLRPLRQKEFQAKAESMNNYHQSAEQKHDAISAKDDAINAKLALDMCADVWHNVFKARQQSQAGEDERRR